MSAFRVVLRALQGSLAPRKQALRPKKLSSLQSVSMNQAAMSSVPPSGRDIPARPQVQRRRMIVEPEPDFHLGKLGRHAKPPSSCMAAARTGWTAPNGRCAGIAASSCGTVLFAPVADTTVVNNAP